MQELEQITLNTTKEVIQEPPSLTNTLTEVKNEEGKTLSPEIEAVMFLKSALPKFREKLMDDNRITGTQAKNVLLALTEAPLTDTPHVWNNKEAEDLFILGLMISNAKLLLFREGIKEETFKQAEALNEISTVVESVSDVKQGENNG